MNDVGFEQLLKETREVGYVERVSNSVVYVDGLPGAKLKEMLVFEGGQRGQVMAIDEESIQVMMLSREKVRVGMKAARSDKPLGAVVGEFMLGKVVDGLGRIEGGGPVKAEGGQWREVDTEPLGIAARAPVTRPLETGIKVVDMVVPLGMGQRELVVGDRKTGKSSFLFQVMMSQAKRGLVCVYGAIGRSKMEIKQLEERLAKLGLTDRVVIVGSSSAEATGLVVIAPYTAMTIAEYFRDKGQDVVVILDDMTTHARYYREVALLAKRFPGRNSYPGDIFYLHSRLLERAGSYLVKMQDGQQREVSITCLPSVESVQGDVSGYIQTNVMAMTDGHLFFDRDLYNLGQRPAVSPFLSVTRVGEQAQNKLMQDLSLQLSSFLTKQREVEDLMHFGAELSVEIKQVIDQGGLIRAFLTQSATEVVPMSIGAVMLAGLLGGLWQGMAQIEVMKQVDERVAAYEKDAKYRELVDQLYSQAQSFNELVDRVRENEEVVLGRSYEMVGVSEQRALHPYDEPKVLSVDGQAEERGTVRPAAEVINQLKLEATPGVSEAEKGSGVTGKALNK